MFAEKCHYVGYHSVQGGSMDKANVIPVVVRAVPEYELRTAGIDNEFVMFTSKCQSEHRKLAT